MKKILIVKTSSLGDIIHALPAAEYLKATYPQAQIDWVVEEPFSEILKSHPAITNVLCINTKNWRKSLTLKTLREILHFRKRLREHIYDCVFDFQGNTKSAWITLQSLSLQKVGFDSTSVHEWPNLLVTHQRFRPPSGCNVRDENLSLVYQFLKSPAITVSPQLLNVTPEQQSKINAIITPAQRTVLICPGSAWPNKQMSESALSNFLKLLQQHYQCRFLFAWGTPAEEQMVMRLREQVGLDSEVIERLSIPMLQNLMARVALVIAMDSLPLHLAGTTSTPTYSIFGASSSLKYKPLGTLHHSFQGPCPYGQRFERRCPMLRTCNTGACIRNLTGHELFADFKSRWKTL